MSDIEKRQAELKDAERALIDAQLSSSRALREVEAREVAHQKALKALIAAMEAKS